MLRLFKASRIVRKLVVAKSSAVKDTIEKELEDYFVNMAFVYLSHYIWRLTSDVEKFNGRYGEMQISVNCIFFRNLDG